MSTVRDILTQFYLSCREANTPSYQQAKAAFNIINCKTKALGGHVQRCNECAHTTMHYNSCRDRHCPMCQGVTNALWVDQRSKDVVNAPYFHVVFTMPEELHPLVYQNQKLLYTLMYDAVAETLSELCGDQKYLGAKIGFISVLHTWSQDLRYHPHIHTVVMAGGLTKLNKWQKSSEKFFIPVKVLSKKIRGKFLCYLKQYYTNGQLKFYGGALEYQSPKHFQGLVDLCYAKDWYTYTKKTFKGPQAVLKYLGNYTRRIAISNSRIVCVDKDTVTFTVKNRKEPGTRKTLTLSGLEFTRRFLMHVLPKRFVKVRYYGLLAGRNKKTKLALCQKLTCTPPYKPVFEGLSTLEIVCLLTGRDVTLCPACQKGKLKLIHTFSPKDLL
jgi:hypothetical protein